MKQIVQNVRSGQVIVEEVPPPGLKAGGLLVRTVASAVSAGTERLAMEFGRKSLLRKAWERPDLARRVIEKFKRDGFLSTYQAVEAQLKVPLSLGYSSAGIVEGVGEGVGEFQVGDRVACGGAGYANHAEVAWIPKNLCVRVPADVSLEDAAFATIGAIALQGIRLVEPSIGEAVVVIGLGLVGQIASQCLKAGGCRVFGIEPDAERAALARHLGVDEVEVGERSTIVERVNAFTRGRGADAVIVAASTEGSEPVEIAGEISRRKGRVVIIGAVGMTVPRRIYYDRELTLKVSTSYGPGRYDPVYEEKGMDYPVGYVRWTEQRNMEACLDLIAEKKISVEGLVTHRFPIEQAGKAYDLLSGKSREKYLGILLSYPNNPDLNRRVVLAPESLAAPSERVGVGLIGAGSFARSTLLPILKRLPAVSFQGIATSDGASSKATGARYGFRYCTADYGEILSDARVGAVVIATPHRLHAPLVMEALKARKHVFVEKPLCIKEEELKRILDTYTEASTSAAVNGAIAGARPLLMVGFNRRFAPFTERAKEFFAGRKTPLFIDYRVNAGPLPRDHWLNDPEEGGRIVGEVCHFVDFINCLVGQPPGRVSAECSGNDAVSVLLKYDDGSMGTIRYVAAAHRLLPKERIEILSEGKVFVIDDFRRAQWLSDRNRGRVRFGLRQDKGHRAQVEAFVDAVINGKASPIDANDIFCTTRVTFKIQESLALGLPVRI